MKYPKFYFRPVITVMSFTVHASETGNLTTVAQYHTGVKESFQVWSNGNPRKERGSFYLGVVFRLEEYPRQWMAVDAHGSQWSSYGDNRLRAAEYIARRFYNEDSF